MKRATTERMSSLFGALANPTRIQIVRELTREALNVTAISELLKISQSSTSQHLAQLERVGLIKVTRAGTSRIYEIRGPRVAKILELAQEFCQVHGLHGFPEEIEETND
jgi:DNA-binding transcriptional ArsR family regulator